MSHENVETVRIGYQRFVATGEFADEIVTADFVWDMSNFHGWPEQQVYAGADGARTFLKDWTDAWEDWQLEVADAPGWEGGPDGDVFRSGRGP